MTPSAARMASEAEVREAAEAAALLKYYEGLFPLLFGQAWHNEKPRTSQRAVLLAAADPLALLIAALGGNRSGKSIIMAMWGVANAAGRDAVVETGAGPVYWVREWLARNCLPANMIPRSPGNVWFGSPAFPAACHQIRPHIRRFCPAGTKFVRWDQQAEAEFRLPGGGLGVSKAYKQFDGDHQSWEGGSNIRAVCLDEQPNQYDNLLAALSRLIDEKGKCMIALTPLRGKSDWFYEKVVQSTEDDYRIVHLYGEDNPHVPQATREKILRRYPAWQLAARSRGEFVSPEGGVFSFQRGVHKIAAFEIPVDWVRWQGIDWGGRAPHATWSAEVKHPFTTPDGVELQSGDLVVYREVAPRRTVKEPAITDRQFIGMIKDEESRTPEGLGLVHIWRVADSENPGAIIEATAELGYVIPATKGAGSIVKGLDLVDSLLQTVDPVTMEPCRPRLYIMETCPVTIEEVESLKWADAQPGVPPAPAKGSQDHGPDTLRYVVQQRAGMAA